MINHPRNAQAVIDQRWKELQVTADRERLAMSAQPPAAHVPTWLQCPRFRLAFMRQSLAGWRPGFARDTDGEWRTAS